MLGIIGSAEGGNRTLIPVGNTILSRARLPIPPLRLTAKASIPLKICSASKIQNRPASLITKLM